MVVSKNCYLNLIHTKSKPIGLSYEYNKYIIVLYKNYYYLFLYYHEKILNLTC